MITNYTQLQAAIGNWLHRSDLQAISTDLITLTEARLNRNLRVRQMEKTLSQQVSASSVALPDDWIEFVGEPRLGGRPLTFVTRDEYRKCPVPDTYTVIGSTLVLGDQVSEAVKLDADYYARIPALTSSASTNWLLASAPDVYLYGSLLEAAPYMNNDPRIETWRGLLQVAMSDLQMASDRAKYSGGTLAIGAPR